MISKNKIKLINSLDKTKYRDKYNLFIIEGPKLFNEFWKSNFEIEEIFTTESFANQIKLVKPVIITENELQKISKLKTPNSVLAIVKRKSKNNFIENNQLYLALESVRDPGNLGTIIRTAEWFGFKKIICSNDCVDVYNPKVIQSSMGSVARVEVFYEDLQTILNNTTLSVYATHLNGENIYKTKLSNSGYILMGNESQGISKELEKIVNHKIKIPGYNNSETESLNVSIATALVCAEFKRRLV